MATNQQINLEIIKLKNLPSLPKAASQILDAINDSNIAIDELANVLKSSPELVGRLLGLANSAYFGRAGKVHNLKDAIIKVLGLNLVKSMSLSIVLNKQLDTSHCRAFNADKFWVNAILTAQLTQAFAKTINGKKFDPALMYTSGLLLNIGMIVAIHLFPDEMNQVFSEAANEEQTIAELMDHYIGLDQFQFGLYLLNHWHLPEIYKKIIGEYNNPEYSGQYLDMIKLIKANAVFSRYLFVNQECDGLINSTSLAPFGVSAAHLEKVLRGVVVNLDNIIELAAAIHGE